MHTLGVILPGILYHDYLGEVFRGVADTTKQHQYALLVSIQNRIRQDNLAPLLEDDNCDGVIAVAPYNFSHILELCRQHQRPYALVDYPVGENIDGVITIEAKNRAASREVVEHLLALGHRRIGHIGGSLITASGQDRLDGYLDALQAAGIDYDPALVGQGNWEQQAAYNAARTMLELPQPPTAIAAACDLSAFGVMQAGRQLGLEIGRQLSVAGFDDIRGAVSSKPPLTTVHQPIYAMGKTAVELLIRQLRGETLPELHIQLDTELIVRQSTGRSQP